MKTRLLVLTVLFALIMSACAAPSQGSSPEEVEDIVATAVADALAEEVDSDDDTEADADDDTEADTDVDIVLTDAQECWVAKLAEGDCLTQMALDQLLIGGEISLLEIRKIGDWEVTHPTSSWRIWDKIPGYRVTKARKTVVREDTGEESFLIWDLGPSTRIPTPYGYGYVLIGSTLALGEDWNDLRDCTKIEDFMFFYLCDAKSLSLAYLPRADEGFTGATFIWGSEDLLRKLITLAMLELDPSLLP